ncbi:MAG: alkaline phosphatase family protein, partial [Bacteroidota bacterium]
MNSGKHIFFFLLLLLPVISLSAQKIPSQKPRLIVGITVSGMRYDYLTVYWDRFGDDGFRKMAGTGTICRNARYNSLVTESAVGYATIATGASPETHGIAADYWYERLKKQVRFCVSDESVNTVGGSYEAGKYSPSALMMRTLSDELRVVSRFKSRVVGVSMDPKAAILLSGHTADEVFWIDPLKLTWTTSSFYQDSLPAWVDRFNKKDFPSVYLQEDWSPMLPLSEYSESMLDNNPYETGFNGQITFPYEMKRLSDKIRPNDHFNVLMATPYGNTFTKDFAISAIVEEQLGKRGATDWININFSASKYLADRYSTWSLETEDLYLRLDKDLSHLLEFLDSYIGLENV